MTISNKGILKKKSEFSFQELIRADRALSDPKNAPFRQRYIHLGEEKEAFGDLLKNPKFKKELRKLQEKHKLLGVT